MIWLACLLACATAFAQDASIALDSASKNSVRLVGVIMALPAGTTWLSVRRGWCIYNGYVRTASGARDPQSLPPYTAAFRLELERAGYKVVSPEDNLFDPNSGASDYQVAAVVTDAHIEGCVSTGMLTDFGSLGDGKGSGTMKIDWQFFSPIKNQVVARVSTSGSGKVDTYVQGGLEKVIVDTFAGNVRELASNADFRAAINAPKALEKGFVMPGQQSAILLAGSLKAGPRKIADATGSVVTILTGSGTGSGILISTDGYVLTDAHVVGDEKTVRVRWSDGLETLASVERVSKPRDVAVIKTNPRDRVPLALKRGPVTPGQRVYAIGSPKGTDFQGTLSSGIVSADRVVEGLRYIQSDTMVSHGSSGGPLLDETGAVIGITDLGIDNQGPAGLNLFTPIGDAMDFLSLQQR